jgi:uncharacterized protein HemY
LVGRLLALDRPEAALDELREMASDFGDTPTTRLLRAWAELRKSGDVSDTELADLVRLDPVSPEPRRVVVSVLVARKRWDQVFAHLQVLKRMHAFGERETKLEAIARSFLANTNP